jgi:hypothetical protein
MGGHWKKYKAIKQKKSVLFTLDDLHGHFIVFAKRNDLLWEGDLPTEFLFPGREK